MAAHGDATIRRRRGEWRGGPANRAVMNRTLTAAVTFAAVAAVPTGALWAAGEFQPARRRLLDVRGSRFRLDDVRDGTTAPTPGLHAGLGDADGTVRRPELHRSTRGQTVGTVPRLRRHVPRPGRLNPGRRARSAGGTVRSRDVRDVRLRVHVHGGDRSGVPRLCRLTCRRARVLTRLRDGAGLSS